MAVTSIQDAETPRGPRQYGNYRRPQSAGMLKLGRLGTFLLFGIVLVSSLLTMVLGFLQAAIFALLGLMLLALARKKDADNTTALSRTANRAGWWRARGTGANVYRSGPLGRTEWGTCQLPGLAARSDLSEHTDSYGRRFGMVHMPQTNTFTVTIASAPSGEGLVDEHQVDLWVARWGHWLAELSDEPGLECASVTIETAPDSGTRLRTEVERHLDPNAPPFALAAVREAVETYPAGSSTVRAYVALSYNASLGNGAPPRKASQVARDIATRLPSLTQALQSTGAGAAKPMNAQELCEVVRAAYDPASATVIDDARMEGRDTGLSWDDVGPAAHQASWDAYRHDSGYSMTWAMTRAPRGIVYSNVLSRLLQPNHAFHRKRVTWLYRPVDSGTAADLVEKDVATADFNVSAEAPRVTARSALAQQAAKRTAAEEAVGAGLTNFGALVTVTIDDPARAAEASAVVDSLAPTARLRLRRQYGSQDSAFAAALPIGLILEKHLRVPRELREDM